MTERLLLDENYGEAIAAALRALGHDVVSVVADDALRAATDAVVFASAAAEGRRVVTENIKDFRPLLVTALGRGEAFAPLLLVSPRRFPRGSGDRAAAITAALAAWLEDADAGRGRWRTGSCDLVTPPGSVCGARAAGLSLRSQSGTLRLRWRSGGPSRCSLRDDPSALSGR
ncbi:DUF5615 family PIN-like protein [Microbacterium sp. NPDC055312]